MRRHYTSALSALFGKFADTAFPAPIQRTINQGYVKLMKLDMSPFAAPASYPTLNALFTRAFVTPPRRPVAPDAIVSPCDAKVTEAGTICDSTAMQIKGMAYDLAALLSGRYAHDLSRLEGGAYLNLYLSPRDYHRYHAPMDLEILSLLHVPGKLYPVNMPLLRNKLNLFVENERIVLECRDPRGAKHYIVLVGALNVGRMVVTFDESVQTNARADARTFHSYDAPISLKIGEVFGWFEMGSTILLFSEAGSATYTATLGRNVRFGEPIGHTTVDA
jgi:phosphatidylserine decarboxylase